MVPRLASNVQMRRGKILAVAGLLSLSQPSFCQWQDLDAFMLDQVESGWWIPQDRLLVLGHLEQTGSPVAHEEAFAIEGLSRQAAEALSKSSEWLDLVQQAGNDDSQGDGLGWEFRAKKDGWFNSLRFRNQGKWALRWDAGNGRPTGYAVVRGSRRPWRAIVGGHRVGWGHRLLMEEGALFGGLDAPTFALPVHYNALPAWGSPASIPRRGLAFWSAGPKNAAVSIHEGGRDVAAALRSQSGDMGSAVRWQAGGVPAAVSVWKEGYSGNRHWLVEGGRLENGWGLKSTCQWVPSWREEGRIQLEAYQRVEEVRWDLRAAAGGEWSSAHQRLRMRWLMNWSNTDLPHPFWLKWRYRVGSGHACEVHWRTVLSPVGIGDHLRRFEVRWTWKADPHASRFVWVPCWDEGLVGGAIWSFSSRVRVWRFRNCIAVWNLPAGRRAYASEPTLGGTAYRMLSGSGHRWVASLERKVQDGWVVKVWASLGNQGSVAEGTDMLTPTYAQSQIQCAVRLNM